jgi:hypothetical protein
MLMRPTGKQPIRFELDAQDIEIPPDQSSLACGHPWKADGLISGSSFNPSVTLSFDVTENQKASV